MTTNLKEKMTAFALMIALTATLAQAGFIDGPQNHVDRVLANSVDTYELVFIGGEFAAITVDGDGDTDLDLFVFDQRGNLVAWDDDLTDYCVVGFYVPQMSTYTVRIVNHGSVWNEYVLSVN